MTSAAANLAGGAVLTDHARTQMAQRAISEADVRAVLADPDDLRPVRTGRIVAQKVLPFGAPPRDHLYRVFVDVDRSPPEVVTAYRTSRLERYRAQT